jgi:hypothetical protein
MYAPRNRNNKNEFELTSKDERVVLFHGIVEAIHHQGDGLESLSYTSSANKQVLLLTEAEILHLKDVAGLLDKLKPLVLLTTIFWIFLVLLIYFKRFQVPTSKQLLLNTILLLVVVAIILSFGPERIFNQLHIWVFPENHQWFFYYEDSLMSTMMKAPDLFAYIISIWMVISILLTIVIFKSMRFYLHPDQKNNRIV